jgi:hypothetical protein
MAVFVDQCLTGLNPFEQQWLPMLGLNDGASTANSRRSTATAPAGLRESAFSNNAPSAMTEVEIDDGDLIEVQDIKIVVSVGPSFFCFVFSYRFIHVCYRHHAGPRGPAGHLLHVGASSTTS